MPLETATYISDLNSTNPTTLDDAKEGDDHLRLLKSTIKSTFPNVTGAVLPTHTELNFVDGVTSPIQTQFSNITTLIPNITGPLTPTHTELNFVDGVTSPIQTQLDTLTASGAAAPLLYRGTVTLGSPTSAISVTSTYLTKKYNEIMLVINGLSRNTAGTDTAIIETSGNNGTTYSTSFLEAIYDVNNTSSKRAVIRIFPESSTLIDTVMVQGATNVDSKRLTRINGAYTNRVNISISTGQFAAGSSLSIFTAG